jgi:uncharacterized tellurite resistance protein B-like protein
MAYKVVLEDDKSKEVLSAACPVCGEDMYLRKFVKYFTLFNKALFPVNTIDTFYKCDVCEAAYNTGLKELLKLDDRNKELKIEEAGKLYAKALIASMTFMAMVDGDLDEKEQLDLHGIIGKYSEIADELIETMDYVKLNGNKNNFVYKKLRKVREELSSDSVLAIISSAVKMILADGQMKKEEKMLIDSFLIESNLPKDLYPVLIERMMKK